MHQKTVYARADGRAAVCALGGRGDDRRILQACVTGILALIWASAAAGAPATQQMAQNAAKGWLKTRPAPFGAMHGGVVAGAESYKDQNGELLYHVVNLEPSGFIVVPADDRIEPIIAFAPKGRYQTSGCNPLAALVSRDLARRKSTLSSSRGAVGAESRSGVQTKWDDLIAFSGSTELVSVAVVPSDICVAPLVISEWDQSLASGAACYNYFTPPGPAGAITNYVCGCTATAFAQLMRYYCHPVTPIGVRSFTCSYWTNDVWVRDISLNTRGGDGFGGAYSWNLMPLKPAEVNLSTAERMAIGSLTYDAAVSIESMFDYALGQTGSFIYKARDRMLDTFQYSNAIYSGDTNGISSMVNASLDARCPVLFAISGNNGGHAIVCDGYGYDGATPYHHLNLGWSGSSTAWYVLPTIITPGYTFDAVDGCVYNVYTSGVGEIISGRITDASGAPIGGVVMTLDDPTNSTCLWTTTDAQGVYSFKNLGYNHDYTIIPGGASYSPANRAVRTGKSDDSHCGNVWGVNFASSLYQDRWVYGRATETTAGTGLSGVSIQFSNGGGTVTTISDGTYSNHVTYGWSGILTASKSGMVFTPSSISLSNVYSAQTGKDFAGHLTQVLVQGSVPRQDNGQGLDGVSIAFSGGAGTVQTAGGGLFSNQVAYGWSGTLTPSLTGWTFSPSSYTFSSPLTAPPSSTAFTAAQVSTKLILTLQDAYSIPEGESRLVGVCLAQNPSGTVVVAVQWLSGDPDIVVTSGSSLTFNAGNWQTPQYAQVNANTDADKVSGTAIVRCSASGWVTKDVAVTELDTDGGSVQVFIEPAGARSAGAQWRIDSGSWHNSGEVQSEGVPWCSDFQVQFREISGWLTPPTQVGLVNSFTPFLVATGTYVSASSAAGMLTVVIQPPEAAAAGGRWRVDGGAWQTSDATVCNLAGGNHTVDFNSVTGYVKPAGYTVNINGGRTTGTVGLYSLSSSCTYVSPGQSIQTAINNASSGQTVVLNDGTFTISSTIQLTKGIVLRSVNGCGSSIVTISGTTGQQCINVSHSNAVVDGIAFTGADTSAYGNGGGMVCSPGLAINCKFHNNIGGYGAGAWCGAGAKLVNCVADSNVAYRDGGGVNVNGAGMVLSSVIKNNTVRSDYSGGGFYIYGNASSIGMISNCLVTGNNANTLGNGDGAGGCATYGRVLDCVISANVAKDAGGGLYLGDGAVVKGCSIANNQAAGGGGLFVNGSGGCPADISSSTIQQNQALSYHGGGIWGDASLMVSNCFVVSNTAARDGGGVYSYNPMTIKSCILNGNTAQTNGGGIYAEGLTTIENCLIIYNRATGGNGGGLWTISMFPSKVMNTTLCNNQCSGRGGGIYYDNSNLPVVNSIVMNNTATTGNPNYRENASGYLVFSYSCASPLPTGSGNKNADPQFKNAGAGDYHLLSSSPCVDAGTASGAPAADMDAVPRPLNGNGSGGAEVDMGCYEYAPPSGSLIVRIDPIYAQDAGGSWSLDGSNWIGSDVRVDYITPGTTSVYFKAISGWQQPGTCSITIVTNTVASTNGLYLPLSGDTDTDDMPDSWEIQYFGRLTNATLTSDADHDGLPDCREYLAGTDPTNAMSCIIFNEGGISVVAGYGVVLRWYSGEGMCYGVWRSTNLFAGFVPVDTNVAATPPMNFFSDTLQQDVPAYYRIKLRK